MIDTGADNTTLSLIDVERMGLDYRRLRRDSLVLVQGIAGEQLFYQEEGIVMLRDEDAKTYVFPINVHIPKRGEGSRADRQRQLPSILGRDIINQCNIRINFHDGTVELEAPEGAKLPTAIRRLL